MKQNKTSTEQDGAATENDRIAAPSPWRGTDYGQWLVADTCTSVSNSIQDFALTIIAQTVTGPRPSRPC